jgi:hypothetical protein
VVCVSSFSELLVVQTAVNLYLFILFCLPIQFVSCTGAVSVLDEENAQPKAAVSETDTHQEGYSSAYLGS